MIGYHTWAALFGFDAAARGKSREWVEAYSDKWSSALDYSDIEIDWDWSPNDQGRQSLSPTGEQS